MPESGKWKSKLLSSSVPMEYEVARTLVELGFAIDADYSYAREDAGITKDFSVDIRATGYPPFRSSKSKLLATIELLVECKHRHRGNKWLFFQDPNIEDMSPFMLGHTIRAVDSFSSTFIPANSTDSFDQQAIFCIKGVEIDASSGNVYDTEIKHGLAQLQYALPRLLTDSIRFNICNHQEDNLPFFYCPILLTTSEILVANSDISIKSVENASTLEEFSVPARYVVVHSDCNPDFEHHRQSACSSLAKLANHSATKSLDTIRQAGGEYDFRLPSVQCSALANLDGEKFQRYFSQTIVCSLGHFADLIKEIKTTAMSAIKSRKKKATRKVVRSV